ncbi:polyprenyl synthetase family protein [Curvibacter gracilis]|uniref:polyprenyl synthetase family protein n=1 Tax=Curvibacter gracilis TaxID=230310 RepID=UPI0012F7EB4E|nr:polyprenyl synthetase family protein [Curvibacter gracilis]
MQAPIPSSFLALIDADLAQVGTLIQQRLNTDVALIAYAAQHIAHSPEQRVRPALALVCGRALGDSGARQQVLAAAVELIHAALALHHEVDLPAEQAPAGLGNAPSVLLGDLLYTGAFRAIVELGDMRVLRVLADATNQVAEGSVMYQQTYQAADAPATADESGRQHLRITQARTASLFEAGARCAAILAAAPPEVEAALAAYGQSWGLVWQLSRESHAETPTPARPTQLSQTALSAALAQAQAALAQARQGLSGLPESPYRQALLDANALG